MAEFLGVPEEDWKKWLGLGAGAALSGTAVGIVRGIVPEDWGEFDTKIDVPAVVTAIIAAYGYRQMGEGMGKDLVGGVVVGSVALAVEPFVSGLVEKVVPSEGKAMTKTTTLAEVEVLTAESAALAYMAQMA